MNENIIKEILAEICQEEIAELNSLPPFKPSLRHRYAMRRIFSSIEKKSRPITGKQPWTASARRPLPLSTRLVILIAVIVCAALLAGAILIYVSKNFRGHVNKDNTQLFVINMENGLETIEYEYFLPNLPEGFEMIRRDSSSLHVFTLYMNEVSEQEITLTQYTKSHYKAHYNTEEYNFEKIVMNGHEAIHICFSDQEGFRSVVIWDNDDYILELFGDLSKNNILELAKSAKILEK